MADTVATGRGYIWVNIAVNVHQKDGTFYGSLNETIPANQFCPGTDGDIQVGESHFTSKPTCLFVSGVAVTSPAFVTSKVTKASDGSGQVPFPAPLDSSPPATGSVEVGDFVHFGFQDNDNPPGQNPTLTAPTTDMLNGVPAFPEGDQGTPGNPPPCNAGEWPPTFHLGDFFGTKQYGNITLHP